MDSSSAEVADAVTKLQQRTESEVRNFIVGDLYRKAGPALLEELGPNVACSGVYAEDEDQIQKIKQFRAYLDMMKKMVKPGCSPDMLKVALDSISSLVNVLTHMSSSPKPRALL